MMILSRWYYREDVMLKCNSFVFLMQNFYGGGAEKVIVNLANELDSKGHSISIIVNSTEGPYFCKLNQDVNVVELNKKRLIMGIFDIHSYLSKVQPDYFISTLDMPNIINGIICLTNKLSNKLSCKFIGREANTISSYSWGDTPLLLFKLLIRKHLYKSIDLIIANSPDTQSEIIEKLRLKNEKVVAIGNPVLNVADIKPIESLLPPFRTDKNTYKLITVGRLEFQKNLFFLIDVIERMSCLCNVTIDIYGIGSLESDLKDYVNNKGLDNNVFFKGFHVDVNGLYSNYDAFVLTSLWEGFGNVYVEALSSGIPIITTKSKGGAKFILNSPDLGTVCPYDINGFVSGVLYEVENNSLEKTIKRVKRAKCFTIESIAKLYKQACDDII
ncbi:putative glycosyltransferase [Photobacterium profundum SS9]|uniref:Glycosyltransferase n=2 Tax=Photobacterium profundum TaxID=74109 RepID=Q6LNR8_PHOPR|nr:putative glycosyltransferase [Photobacterium profundum SS9]